MALLSTILSLLTNDGHGATSHSRSGQRYGRPTQCVRLPLMANALPTHDNPFATLGLPAVFDLPASAIRQARLTLTAAPAGPDDDHDARTAAINAAATTLLDPEQRADALVRLLGGPSREADRTLPPGFLMQMMDVRERHEAALESHDSAKVAEFERWAQGERAVRITEVGRLFASATTVTPNLAAIRWQLNAWRYIERMIEQLSAEQTL